IRGITASSGTGLPVQDERRPEGRRHHGPTPRRVRRESRDSRLCFPAGEVWGFGDTGNTQGVGDSDDSEDADPRLTDFRERIRPSIPFRQQPLER
ncbi:unnamed protein product, partial [Ectocarpus sp. 12 AP-2014]